MSSHRTSIYGTPTSIYGDPSDRRSIYGDPTSIYARTPTSQTVDRVWSPGAFTPPTPVGIGDNPPLERMYPVPSPPPPPPPPQPVFTLPPASVPTIAAPAMPKEQLNNSMWTNVWGPRFGMWNQFNSEARNQAIQRTLGGGEF